MAVIGDVLVKLVADFAEFSKGMDESTKRLEDFGKTIDAQGKRVEGLLKDLRALAILSAAAVAVKQVVDWGLATADAAKQQQELSKQLGFSVDEIQALQKAAKLNGQTFEQQAAYYKTHRAELKAMTDELRDTGKLMAEDTVKAFADIATQIDRFGEIVGRVRQQFEGGSVNTVLGTISKMIRDAGSSLAYFEVYKGTITSVRELMAIFTGAGGLVGISAQQRAIQQIDELRAKAVDAEVALQKATGEARRAAELQQQIEQRGGDAAGRIRESILRGQGASPGTTVAEAQAVAERARQARDQTQKDLAAAEEAFRKAQEIEKKSNEPYKPPPVPTTTGGGGGGSDADDINAIIKRYQAVQKAADDATASVRRNQQADIDDLARIVQARQETQDILARIAQHKTIPHEMEKALEDAIFGAKQAQAETQKSIQYNQQAFELEKRLGDGTVAYARVLRDLNREKATGRLSDQAYTRALKEQTEALQNAALQARRYDDDLGSLAAGFELAARQFERSHDLFSAGGQIFQGLVNVMDEGLDVLAGKSSKTFGDIAADFALMLAKMAAQAAASAIFNSVFGSFGGRLDAGGMGPPTPGSGILGWIASGLGSVFGGGKAAGGEVQPGYYYTVGERGPERFVPQVAGRIEPAASTQGGGNVTINLDMGQTVGADNPAMALAFGRKVKAAVVDVINNEKRPGGALYRRMTA
jgi:lambda family phage tail tape measure protein